MARKIIKIFVAIVILISLLLIVPFTGNKIKYYIARNNPGIAAWLSPFNYFNFSAEYTEAMGFKYSMTKQEAISVIAKKYNSNFIISSPDRDVLVDGIGNIYDYWNDNLFYSDKKLTDKHYGFLKKIDLWELKQGDVFIELHFKNDSLVSIKVRGSKFRI